MCSFPIGATEKKNPEESKIIGENKLYLHWDEDSIIGSPLKDFSKHRNKSDETKTDSKASENLNQTWPALLMLVISLIYLNFI